LASTTRPPHIAADLKYKQRRNALARCCPTRTTRKKLAALGIHLTGSPPLRLEHELAG